MEREAQMPEEPGRPPAVSDADLDSAGVAQEIPGQPVNVGAPPADDAFDVNDSADFKLSATFVGLPADSSAEAAEEAAESSEESEAATPDLTALVASLQDELARERAAFHNFRAARAKQAEVEKDRTRGEVIRVILPVLDDFDRIQKHGELPDPFGAVAAKLRAAVEKIGLSTFGQPGDNFDPNLHEALFQQPSPDVQVETVLEVVESGYRLGETIIRVAKVVVQVPNG